MSSVLELKAEIFDLNREMQEYKEGAEKKLQSFNQRIQGKVAELEALEKAE